LVELHFIASRDGQYGAMYYPPGMWPQEGDTTFAFTEADRHLLSEQREQHALVIDPNTRSPRRVLLLAHEARHVAQNLSNPAISDVAVRLGSHMAGDAPIFYAAMPDERDADATATALRRALRIEVTDEDRYSPDRLLYEAPWGEQLDLNALPRRLVAWVILTAGFDVICSGSQGLPQTDPDALVDALVPGASTIRGPLQQHYAEVLERIANGHGYTDETWHQLSQSDQRRINDDLRSKAVARETEIAREVAMELGLVSTDGNV
jgi:hypothetical protein